MHSLFVRANAIFFFGLSTLFVLGVLNSLSVMHLDAKPVVQFHEVNRMMMAKHHFRHFGKADQASFTFDMTADFTPIVNWNTKQIFVSVYVHYETPTRALNQISIWDRILKHDDNKVINVTAQTLEYGLLDFNSDLRGRTLNLTLLWDVMPIVGMLKADGGPQFVSFPITLPNKYDHRY